MLSASAVLISLLVDESLNDRHALLSFPTRRSSDLSTCAAQPIGSLPRPASTACHRSSTSRVSGSTSSPSATVITSRRSEEHTSELQSRGHLVCRLLLEKKNIR